MFCLPFLSFFGVSWKFVISVRFFLLGVVGVVFKAKYFGRVWSDVRGGIGGGFPFCRRRERRGLRR